MLPLAVLNPNFALRPEFRPMTPDQSRDPIMKTLRFGLLLGLSALTLFLCFSTAADVLVLTDGTQVLTEGAFEVQGKRTTYTDPEGRLLALRSAEIDFEATKKANMPAPKGMPSARDAAVPPHKEPVLVLTDADIPAGDTDSENNDGPAASQITLYVTDWCGYCRKTERLLNELEVAYETVDVEKVPGARAEKNRVKPGCGVPVVVIADESVCGYAENKIREMVEGLKASESPTADGTDGQAGSEATEAEEA